MTVEEIRRQKRMTSDRYGSNEQGYICGTMENTEINLTSKQLNNNQSSSKSGLCTVTRTHEVGFSSNL